MEDRRDRAERAARYAWKLRTVPGMLIGEAVVTALPAMVVAAVGEMYGPASMVHGDAPSTGVCFERAAALLSEAEQLHDRTTPLAVVDTSVRIAEAWIRLGAELASRNGDSS